MSARRIALFAAGLLTACAALFLIVRGFGGAAAAGPEAAAPEAAAGAAHGGRGEDKAPPPSWQSFLRPDERKAPLAPLAPPRPLVHLANLTNLPNLPPILPDPFRRSAPPAVGRARRPANPGFELEGVSVGARTVALISGRAVREGDTLAGYRIVRIGRSAVTLAGPRGDRLDLTLKGTLKETSKGGGG
jgi:hypothetical protein